MHIQILKINQLIESKIYIVKFTLIRRARGVKNWEI